METSITGYYTTPNCSFNLSNDLLKLLADTIDNEILKKYPLPNVSAKEFEILLNTNRRIRKIRANQKAKSTNNQFLSYEFLIPYKLVVSEEQLQVPFFIESFIVAVENIYKEHEVDLATDFWTKIISELKKKTEDNPKYIYKPSDKQKAWQAALKKRKTKVKETV